MSRNLAPASSRPRFQAPSTLRPTRTQSSIAPARPAPDSSEVAARSFPYCSSLLPLVWILHLSFRWGSPQLICENSNGSSLKIPPRHFRLKSFQRKSHHVQKTPLNLRNKLVALFLNRVRAGLPIRLARFDVLRNLGRAHFAHRHPRAFGEFKRVTNGPLSPFKNRNRTNARNHAVPRPRKTR